MKAAIYARVSTEDQAGDDRFSLSSQLDECRQYADEKGYEVVAEFVDEFTGTLPNRPELDRLRQLFGSIDVVLVHNPDRLSRDAVDLLMLERELREAGAPIEFLHVSYDTNTSIGQLMLFLEGVNAQEYRRKMLEQTARGKRQKAKEGQILFAGFEPYGYRRGTDQHGKAIADIVPEEAEIVRLIFHWYVNGDENGSSMGDTLIAMRLTEMQVPCKRQDMGSNRRKNANVWESKTIASILKNELYIGVWHYNKTKAVGKPNAKGKRTKRAPRPRSEWIAVPVPKIIERDQWEAAQEIRKSNRHYQPRNLKYKYLIQGRLTCTQCDLGFTTLTDNRRKNLLQYYSCRGQRARNTLDGKKKCYGNLRSQEIDVLIWEEIAEILRNPEYILEVLIEKQQDAEKELEPLRKRLEFYAKELEKIERKRARLLQLYEDETLEIAELKHRIQQLDDQYDAFQQKQADLEGRISQTVISEMQAEQIKAYCLAARDGIDHFTFEDKRMVIERLDVRGYIERGETTKDYRITITGFFPPTEVSSEHDATLCVCEDEGFRHVTEDNMSRFCGLRPVDHHAG